jgi:formylglycine-generating enzyme required for sulfatase activity
MDMAGNVWEWTASNYENDKNRRLLRGGSFHVGAAYLRAAYRFDFRPDFRYHDFGFRCAQDPVVT